MALKLADDHFGYIKLITIFRLNLDNINEDNMMKCTISIILYKWNMLATLNGGERALKTELLFDYRYTVMWGYLKQQAYLSVKHTAKFSINFK